MSKLNQKNNLDNVFLKKIFTNTAKIQLQAER